MIALFLHIRFECPDLLNACRILGVTGFQIRNKRARNLALHIKFGQGNMVILAQMIGIYTFEKNVHISTLVTTDYFNA